jgi:amino-acid N-acetyltransferase
MTYGAPLPVEKSSREETKFSKATPGDLHAVRTLLRSCDLPIDDLTPDHLEHFVLCHVRDRLVGSVGLEAVSGEAALLRSLAVASGERARGLGRELWTRARQHAGALAVKRLYLLTTTAESLFRKWGFRRVPRDVAPEGIRATAEFNSLCPATAVVMVLDIE